MEEWRPIHISPDLEISSLGFIRKIKTKKPRCIWVNNWGYIHTQIKGKKYSVHRLVGFAFLKCSYFEGAIINHKNGVKTDNRVDNLEWCTQSENAKHSFRIGTHSIVGERHPSAKLNEQKVIEIRRKRRLGYTCRQLSEEYGVHLQTIASCTNGSNWTHI